LRVLEPCRVSIISERRQQAPQGEDGGGEGARGRNLLNGVELPAKVTRELAAGDLVRIETPGGGGHGPRGGLAGRQ
jgi:N-methylhydantoinase B